MEFLTELAELLNKHNATIELERVWENEHSCSAELSFSVGGIYLDYTFSSLGSCKTINADDILNLINQKHTLASWG